MKTHVRNFAAVVLATWSLNTNAIAGPIKSADGLVSYAAMARYTYGISSNEAGASGKSLADGTKLKLNWVEIVNKSILSDEAKKALISDGSSLDLMQIYSKTETKNYLWCSKERTVYKT